MSRRPVPLTAGRLGELPPDCRRCLFWELPDAGRGPRGGPADAALEAKQLWHRSIELDAGPPVLAVARGGATIAYALTMPPNDARRLRRLGTTVSDDALVLATVWVDPACRGEGIARDLVIAVLRRADDAGLRAVEAVGERSGRGTCLIPEPFLAAMGFELHRPHPRFPLFRLDLRRTVRWHDAVEHALDGVRQALGRREPHPAPAAAGMSGTSSHGPRSAAGPALPPAGAHAGCRTSGASKNCSRPVTSVAATTS